MSRIFVLNLALLMCFSPLFAQIKVTGVVTDAKTKETIIRSIIRVQGTNIATVTDIDGKYSIELEEGDYTITVEADLYRKLTQEVKISKTLNVLNFSLDPTQEELGEVRVVQRIDKESETTLVSKRRLSGDFVQNIGSKQLSEKGVTNAMEGATKIVGISSQRGKYLVVRGLGDRYNNINMNGLPLPTLDPVRKILQMDLFPTEVIGSLEISKVAMPDIDGDFSGGSIQINTKSYPEKFKATAEVKMDYNTQVNYNTFHQVPNPSPIFGNVKSDIEPYLEADGDLTPPFPPTIMPSGSSIFPATSAKVTLGNVILQKGSKEWGYLVTMGYKQKFSQREGEFRKINSIGEIQSNLSILNQDKEEAFYSLFTTTYHFNSAHNISANVFYYGLSDNAYTHANGEVTDGDVGTRDVKQTKPFRNKILTTQILGSHSLSETMSLNWGGTYFSGENANINTRRITTLDGAIDGSNKGDVNNSQRYGILESLNGAGRLDLSYKSTRLTNNKPTLEIKAGTKGTLLTRNFNQNTLGYPINNEELILTTAPASVAQDSRFYEASETILAFFGKAAWNISKKWYVNGGIRVENYTRSTSYYKTTIRENISVPYNDLANILPSINIKYELSKRNQFRLIASKTLTRPNVREAVNFRDIPTPGSFILIGNDELINSNIYNLDLRFDHFGKKNDLYSIGLFYKYIQDPIERIPFDDEFTVVTFVNGQWGYLYGIEAEFNYNLARLFNTESKILIPWSISTNIAYITSKVSLGEEFQVNGIPHFNKVDSEREMLSASPYLINFDLKYTNSFNDDKYKTTVGLAFNVTGRAVFFASQEVGMSNAYELPQPSLNLVWRNTLHDKWNINFRVKNLLNSPYTVEQVILDQPAILQNFVKGVEFSLSIGYQI